MVPDRSALEFAPGAARDATWEVSTADARRSASKSCRVRSWKLDPNVPEYHMQECFKRKMYQRCNTSNTLPTPHQRRNQLEIGTGIAISSISLASELLFSLVYTFPVILTPRSWTCFSFSARSKRSLTFWGVRWVQRMVSQAVTLGLGKLSIDLFQMTT